MPEQEAATRGSHGKVAIATGASRPIRLGIAQRLVSEGARVRVTARKPETLALWTFGSVDLLVNPAATRARSR